ncbi:SGNH/GDSL hydrolase family protein [Sphingomonas sp.]|uniref:SGNH/GDSL hydrolase family protein n=1 Tax=Sphingomonas sp. TaxID=28214 RepID=UPI0025FC4928|nr:SGNH/GDSL hydrolase family protein [Sphingomonas sp.]
MATSTAAISQVIAFGDSLSDIGQGYVDGNGPTAIACMADRLGIDLLPGRMASSDCRASRCYAVSGAGSGSGEGTAIKSALFGRGLLAQIGDFEEALRSATLAIDAGTLFFIAIGLNDRQLSSEQIIAHFEIALARLHACGARRFAIARLPEISAGYVDVARRMNALLPQIVANAVAAYPDARIHLSDFGSYFDEIRRNSIELGIDNADEPCAPGRALFGENPERNGDPARYFYYHPDHPSAAVHAIVGTVLAVEMREAFDVPSQPIEAGKGWMRPPAPRSAHG